MKKWIKFMVCTILCVLPLTMTAHAHSGGTDSKGRHYNHSTGDYHYHHGYSVHDHYDMNGDGKADCPYTFNDKTTQKGSGKSSTGAGSYIAIGGLVLFGAAAIIFVRKFYDHDAKK